MARCGCSSSNACSCVLAAGDNTTVSGAGTAVSPYRVNVSCEAIQDCVGAAMGNGLVYDDAANQFRARLSTDPGNTMLFGGDGGLYTPASAVTLGCGLEFGGAGEIQANTPGAFSTLTRRNCDDVGDAAGTTPLAGPSTAGAPVYCDANGDLRTMPEKFYETGIAADVTAFSPAITVLPFTTTAIALAITNPSSQYCMCGFIQVDDFPAFQAAPGTVIDVSYGVDQGDGGGFGFTTISRNDQRGQSATVRLDRRFTHQLPVCLDPGETKTFQFETRLARGPGDNGGAVSLFGVARQLRFFGGNI